MVGLDTAKTKICQLTYLSISKNMQISNIQFITIPNLMNKEPKYLIKFTNVHNDNGTVWYTIDVFYPKEDEHWSFKQRFSNMRDLHIACEKSKYKNQLPVFPPRKLFGSTDQAFIQKRKKELQNYYNTLFKTVDIDQLPDLLHFFNTNKPIKKVQKPNSKSPQLEPHSPIKHQKKDKQQQLKKVFEEIVTKAETEMVQSNEYQTQIEDETRRKFNQQFQKIKLDLKSSLIDQVVLPKGDKENDTDFWNQFFADTHEQSIQKINKVSTEVDNILKESNICSFKFVVSL